MALAPLQPPDAVQDVAFVEDQVRVDEPPEEMADGEAEKLTVGATAPEVTVIEVDLLVEPPAPEHVIVYEAFAVGDTDSVPEVAFDPDQSLDAEQDVALVEDQVRVEASPEAIEDGEAEKETVGAGVGGGVDVGGITVSHILTSSKIALLFIPEALPGRTLPTYIYALELSAAVYHVPVVTGRPLSP